MPEGMKEIILPTGNGGDLGIMEFNTHTCVYICLSLVEKPFQI